MNQTTKRQHYIWRSYLAPWTKNNTKTGQIICLRNDNIFSVSLMKIAQENCFYSVKELSALERKIIYEMTIKNTTGAQRAVNEGWINLYCAPFDFVNDLTAYGYSIFGQTERSKIEREQEFKNLNIEYIEKLHTLIETKGEKYISALRRNDLSFWENEMDRNEFSFFLSNQYFRTKNMRDRMVAAIERAKTEKGFFTDIRPENMWLPLSLVFASNTGVHIAQKFSAVLLQTEDSFFIVGDQPVVNTHSTFDMMVAPKDMELFYPITPRSALLLTSNRKYTSGQILKIGANEVSVYNRLEQRTARELLFAKEANHLVAFTLSRKMSSEC